MKLKRNVLKHIMVDRELKLRELEKLSGVSRQTLSAIGNGKSCSGETVFKIAEALKLSLIHISEPTRH